MQPRTIALLVSLLPIIAANLAYLISAFDGHVPWCIPYIDGCTTISRAARHGDAIYVFRALMMFYAVLLIWYWWVVKAWLTRLDNPSTHITSLIFFLGVFAALCLIIYIDYLGSSGAVYRFMRRHGVILYFSLTPLAHLLMMHQIIKLKIENTDIPVTNNILRYQTTVISLIVIMGITDVIMSYTGTKTYESQNIVEWNYALLMTLFFASSIFMWKGVKLKLILSKK